MVVSSAAMGQMLMGVDSIVTKTTTGTTGTGSIETPNSTVIAITTTMVGIMVAFGTIEISTGRLHTAATPTDTILDQVSQSGAAVHACISGSD